MKVWGSIDEAANDLGITARSVYRRIESGVIEKRRGKDGGWIYVLSDQGKLPGEGDVTSDVTSGVTSTVGVNDVPVGKEKFRHPPQSPKKVIPVEHPSQRVIEQREDVEVTELEVRKEKAVRQLEQLSESKKREEVERKRMIERSAWLSKWVAYALQYFSFSFSIPLDWKVKIKKAVEESLANVSVNEDSDSVWLMVQKIVDELRESYCEKVLCPEAKKELIHDSVRSLRFPMWVKVPVEDDIRSEIRLRMQEVFTGGEMPEEFFEAAQRMKDKILSDLSKS